MPILNLCYLHITQVQIQMSLSRIKYLGIMLSKILDKIIGLNDMSLLNQIENILDKWEKPMLLLNGKENVAEMVVDDV